MHTRQDYLNGRVTLGEYYQQFVTEALKKLAVNFFSLGRLRAAYRADTRLNAIPLREWDSLALATRNPELEAKLKECGDFWSISTGVCIMKTAASLAIEEAEQ